MTRSLPTWPSFTDADATAVGKMLISGKVNYWTGTEVRNFEREFADLVETKHALAVSNGTLALELALRGCGVGIGDEVIVTPRSFIASASAVVNVGATPVFADIDLDTQALSADTISAVITEKTRAVIVVHLGGMPADMNPIMELADAQNFFVIEDCAQAHGAVYDGKPVGSIGDIASWSFCQEKIISTGGEGGMITSNNDEIIAKCWSYRDHGKCQAMMESSQTTAPGLYRWVHGSIGSNFRMLEYQAVLGRMQLPKLKSWLETRERNARIVISAIKDLLEIHTFPTTRNSNPAYYKLYLNVGSAYGRPALDRRNAIVAELVSMGIPCGSGACPELNREKAFSNTNLYADVSFPNAARLGNCSLMLNVHPTLTADDMNYVVDCLVKAVANVDDKKRACQ